MSYGTGQPPAGWYPDPLDASRNRWWDGLEWSDTIRPSVTPPSPPLPGSPVPVPPPLVIAPTPGSPAPGYGPGYAAVPAGYMATPGYAAVSAAPTAGYPAPPTGAWRSPVDDRPIVRGMIDATRVVLTRYARFDGRAGAAEYWYWVLFNVLLGAGVIVLFLLGAILPPLIIVAGVAYFALILWFIGTYVPALAVLVRRLRDAGYAWAFVFLALVPFGSIALLVMCCQRSKYP